MSLLFIVAAIFHLISAIILAATDHTFARPVILHFDEFNPADSLGMPRGLWLPWLLALIVFVLNASLVYFVHSRNKTAAYLLSGVACLVTLLTLIFTVLMTTVN